jgi:hypothetical protein
MADVAEMPQSNASVVPAAPTAPVAKPEVVFHGRPKNMAVGITLLLAGASAFMMGMTDVFFAEAMAWTFVIWGILFLLGDLYDWNRNWVVTDDELIIGVNTPFIDRRNHWGWENVSRMDLVVKRYEPKPQDVVMQVYYTAPGESVLAREDRALSPELARIIVERAGLKPTHANNPTSYEALPPDKTTYIWNKSGKFTLAT